MKKICVIGAGAAGLCVAKHTLEKHWQVVVFEKSAQIGGTWVYNDGQYTDSSMYKNLRTNLPKEVMHFPGFPFPSNLPSFVKHETVLDYLNAYAVYYDLLPHIQFNRTVKVVEPVKNDTSNTKWLVSTQSCLQPSPTDVDTYDSVFICNGHYSQPYTPKIPGQEAFSGSQIHSHFYKEPEIFSGKRVAVLGAGASGLDIALDIAEHANVVYLCHNKPRIVSEFPNNLIQKPAFVSLSTNTIKFDANLNEPELQIDAVVYCTGYEYNFDFVDYSKLDLQVNRHRVAPLYLHLVHAKFSSLFFIGLCFTICPFPNFDVQVRYALSVLAGNTKLPSQDEMNQWIDEDVKFRLENVQAKQMHFLGPRQWDYLKLLASLANFEIEPLVPNVIQKIYDSVHDYRMKHLASYKSLNFVVSNNDFKTLTVDN